MNNHFILDNAVQTAMSVAAVCANLYKIDGTVDTASVYVMHTGSCCWVMNIAGVRWTVLFYALFILREALAALHQYMSEAGDCARAVLPTPTPASVVKIKCFYLSGEDKFDQFCQAAWKLAYLCYPTAEESFTCNVTRSVIYNKVWHAFNLH